MKASGCQQQTRPQRIRPFMMLLTSLGCGMMMMQLGMVNAATTTTTHTEPKTGISFPDQMKRLKLNKLGVRSKGPLKVYAVGLYGQGLFVLKMKMSVSAEKISGALADALKPRCLEQVGKDQAKNAGDGGEAFCNEKISLFKDLILKGLPGKSGGATKGTTLAFDTSGGKITLSINDKAIGNIPSKPLAKAFAGIYTDKNAVCVLHSVHGDATAKNEFPFDMDLEDPITIGTLVVGVVTILYVLVYLVRGGKNSEPQGIVVSELNVYPIKSCAEHHVKTAVVTELGFQGDRVAMVTDAQGVCCTARNPNHAKLFKITPTYNATTQELLIGVHDRSILAAIQVDTTKSTASPKVKHNEAPGYLSLQDYGNAVSAWLTKETGIVGARLTGIGPSYKRNVLVNPSQGDAVPTSSSNNNNNNTPVSLADEAPYLLTNEKSLVDLNRRLKARNQKAVDMRRFRPNIVVKGSNVQAWEEDSWKKIRIGPRLEFFVWQRCGRCAMTTIDRDSLDRCGEPLATLSTFRERSHGMRNFGMHLIPDPSTLSKNPEENVISEHDVVHVIEYDEDRRQEWDAFVRSNP